MKYTITYFEYTVKMYNTRFVYLLWYYKYNIHFSVMLIATNRYTGTILLLFNGTLKLLVIINGRKIRNSNRGNVCF
jgi:hypothetical protein